MVVAQRGPSRRALIFLALLILVIVLAASSRFYTDVLWFGEVGFSDVLWTSLRTQFAVGIGVGVATALIVWLNLAIARRLRPGYRGMASIGGTDPFERYRNAVLPYERALRLAAAILIGLLAGLAAAASWRSVLLWANRVRFGVEDPQFHEDVGFYVFELPFLSIVTDWVWFALMASLFVAAAAHLFYGTIRPEPRLAGISSGALAHLSVLLGVLALVKTVQYWIGRYELNFSERGVVHGASYTDVHAQLPALNVLAAISILSALLFLVNIRVRRLSLPLAAVGIWVLFAILAGGVWPWWVQRFSVEPQEPQREAPYIQRNIEATRRAFNVDAVETQPFAASTDLTGDQVAAQRDLLENVRLWDPGVLQEAYSQLQAIRTYYEFSDVDVDRYMIDGDLRQVLLSARELSLDDIPENSRTWSNLHLQFTHGFGMVASLANESTVAGQPSFLVKDVPGQVVDGAELLEVDQPRIYFGEAFESDDYSIVNSGQEEFDYPVEQGAERTQYDGTGGIELSGMLRRAAFAIRQGDTNFVLSSLIEPDSKVLIYRDVRDRVLRVAPFLSIDQDPYLAVVDGRLVWVIDAYTSTANYPYSQRFDLDQTLHGETTGGFTAVPDGALTGAVNYVRNSVKVAVDAYDGTMTFHVIDPDDPLIRAWQNAFPDLFTVAAPPEALQDHYRYPEDLFTIQSEVYSTYHMTDPQDFYLKEDAWNVPQRLTDLDDPNSRIPVEPTYLLISLPGETQDEFLLTRPFTPHNKSNMISLLAARSDADRYGEMVTLQFPRSTAVPGPLQVDNLINQDPEISQELSLLDEQGSKVVFGSLVILPIEDSILYVQPMFIKGESLGIPELKRVFLVLGEEVVMEETFEDALATLFETTPEDVGAPPDEAEGDEQPPRGDGADEDLQELIERAARVYEQAQAALAEGDFESYGRLIEQLGDLLRRAEGARTGS